MSNAFRHANAQQIEAELSYSRKELCLRVRDDGCGIDKNIIANGLPNHFGLKGMRERAEKIGASFTLWSRNNAGTEIELIIPGPLAFRSYAKCKKLQRYSWLKRLLWQSNIIDHQNTQLRNDENEHNEDKKISLKE